jgi:hypothetical protein
LPEWPPVNCRGGSLSATPPQGTAARSSRFLIHDMLIARGSIPPFGLHLLDHHLVQLPGRLGRHRPTFLHRCHRLRGDDAAPGICEQENGQIPLPVGCELGNSHESCVCSRQVHNVGDGLGRHLAMFKEHVAVTGSLTQDVEADGSNAREKRFESKELQTNGCRNPPWQACSHRFPPSRERQCWLSGRVRNHQGRECTCRRGRRPHHHENPGAPV